MTLFEGLFWPVFMLVVFAASWGLGKYLALIFGQKSPVARFTDRLFGAFRISLSSQHWKDYLLSVLLFNLIGFALLFIVLRFQSFFAFTAPFFENLDFHAAFFIAASFVTNTNLQALGGENTLTYFSQGFGIGVQHFLSAATGLCVALALIRSFMGSDKKGLGNFYRDMFVSVVFLLLPLSIIASLLFAQQGMPQNFSDYAAIAGDQVRLLPQGPVASQAAIKILGGNGGGFFSANAAHPYENPTEATALAQIFLILLIPVSVVFAFGHMSRHWNQAISFLASMSAIYIAGLVLVMFFETQTPPHIGILQSAPVLGESVKLENPGNWEGKEYRFSLGTSAMWAVAATATANGSSNMAAASMHPLSVLVMLTNIQLGEIIYGGVGSGFYTIWLLTVVAMFIAGLMIGRSPSFMGKKIEVPDMKLTMLALLVSPSLVFLGLSAVLMISDMRALVLNPGAGGFTELIYAFVSAAGNNGSSLNGLQMSDPVLSNSLAIVMLLGRFVPIALILALAGSFAAKKQMARNNFDLSPSSVTFSIFFIVILAMLGGLTYLPSMCLGPLAMYLAL